MGALKAIDLFCGAGGSTLGAKMAGVKVVHAYDMDSTSLESYRANHPEVRVHQRDILQTEASDLPKGCDIIMGSTPCESFSLLNMHDRCNDMDLTKHFMKIVTEYRPKYWALENVPQIAKYLKGIPYRLLCAANYGVPQKRMRCMAGNYFEPVQTHAEHPCGDLLPWVKFGSIKDTNWRNYGILSKKAISGAYRRVHEMGMRGNVFRVQFIDEEDVLFTVTSSESHGVRAGSQIVYDKGRLRRLTFPECARAQSFPDGYIFHGDQEQKYKQVGQAVPPLLMKAVLSGMEGLKRT